MILKIDDLILFSGQIDSRNLSAVNLEVFVEAAAVGVAQDGVRLTIAALVPVVQSWSQFDEEFVNKKLYRSKKSLSFVKLISLLKFIVHYILTYWSEVENECSMTKLYNLMTFVS